MKYPDQGAQTELRRIRISRGLALLFGVTSAIFSLVLVIALVKAFQLRSGEEARDDFGKMLSWLFGTGGTVVVVLLLVFSGSMMAGAAGWWYSANARLRRWHQEYWLDQ